MGNYVLAYTGGAMGETPAEQEAAMAEWMQWFGSLGDAVVDGGAPFGPSATVAGDGGVATAGASALTGYSIISADTLAAACDAAKSCPVLNHGGAVEVYEAIPVA
ncbi:MAG: hypothetical protein ABSG81_06045 [Acidimicrobiales bacterium]|jgi:hypothetical protein